MAAQMDRLLDKWTGGLSVEQLVWIRVVASVGAMGA